MRKTIEMPISRIKQSATERMTAVFGFWAGFLTGVTTFYLANLLWSLSGETTMRRLKRILKIKKHKVPVPTGMLTIGANVVPWVVCAFGPWKRENIRCSYRSTALRKHPVVEQLYQELKADFEKQARQGKAVPFNGLGYQLESFDVSGRTVPEEEPILRLSFRPTDYYHMLVTDHQLDVPIVINGQNTTLRKEFAANVDLKVRPVPEFATHFGIALMVVTSDSWTFFAERGNTAVDAFTFFPSVAEGACRPVDQGPAGAVDPYRTAIRGASEELGIELAPEQIEFVSFGANAVLCEYGLIGIAHTSLTVEQVLAARSLGIPKDRWENIALHPVRFDPESIAGFIATHKPWSPFAVVAAVHALTYEFGWERTLKAFERAQIELSENLPPT
jgi:hypothetical protein